MTAADRKRIEKLTLEIANIEATIRYHARLNGDRIEELEAEIEAIKSKTEHKPVRGFQARITKRGKPNQKQ